MSVAVAVWGVLLSVPPLPSVLPPFDASRDAMSPVPRLAVKRIEDSKLEDYGFARDNLNLEKLMVRRVHFVFTRRKNLNL